MALLAAVLAAMATGLIIRQRVVRGGGERGPPPGSVEYHVDVNAADSAELQLLPGVGPTLAEAIIEHRRRRGPFRSVDDLTRVRGIGGTIAAGLKPYVRFGGETR